MEDLNALGLDKETLFNNHCMGELLKGRITSTALPISKEINGEKKDLGEACFMCVKGADGKVELKTLTRLDKPQYDCRSIKAYSRMKRRTNWPKRVRWEESRK